MEDLVRALATHPFFDRLDEPRLRILVGCTKNARFGPGECIFREGDDEGALYLIRHGSVAVEITAPGRPPVVLETLEPGDVFGVSWLTTRNKAHLDCRAREGTLAFHIDGACLKRKMDADPALGYAIVTRLLESTYERLSRARLQKLDVYG
jgi:CRP/FNR family transcriptional regulator, cyclic AMP receptor protein